MSHYEKIAVVIIRAAGCCIGIYALVGAFHSVLISLPKSVNLASAGVSFSVFYLIVGIALFVLSRPLARLIVRGFGDG